MTSIYLSNRIIGQKTLPYGVATEIEGLTGVSVSWKHLPLEERRIVRNSQIPGHEASITVLKGEAKEAEFSLREGGRRIVEGVGLFIHSEVSRT